MQIGPFTYDSHSKTHAAPLALFRILFGILMLISMVRFWYYGWIEKFYIEPSFFFSYYGFEWVKPLGSWTYVLFILCAVSSTFVALGYRYRWSMIVFFLSFTYIELMDKTTYLNHYYFISILGLLMIFLPAASYYSVDAYRDKQKRFEYIPRWTIDSIKLLLGIVYFYAGLAKLQPDWLLRAMPLKLWLPSKDGIPIIGGLMNETWVHYAFSWAGAAYDLLIPFLLLNKKTRNLAFVAVVVFHVLTRILFPIGMFPYIMIVGTLIFFDDSLHNRVLRWFSGLTKIDKSRFDNGLALIFDNNVGTKIKNGLIITFFAVQLILPFRFLAYPGHLFWTEQGFRFSWRVMLMEKAGYANFKVVDGVSGMRFYVDNSDFLTAQQQKMMSTQPDMILEYAHFLGKKFAKDGHQNVEIYVESYVALNGQPSTPFINPEVDLMQIKEGYQHKDWILPYQTKGKK